MKAHHRLRIRYIKQRCADTLFACAYVATLYTLANLLAWLVA